MRIITENTLNQMWPIYLNEKCWEYAWEDIEFKNIFLLCEFGISDITYTRKWREMCIILNRFELPSPRTYYETFQ